VRERPPKFTNFFVWPVYLKNHQASNLQCLFQEGTNIFKVRQHTLSIFIGLPTMHQVTIKAETIIETFGLVIC